MTLDQPTVTLISAGLAATVSLISLSLNLRWNKQLSRLGDFSDDRKEIRKRMKELAELLHRVETSTRRLVALSPQLTPTSLMVEATDTLHIVSDVFRATGSDRLIDYPKDVVESASKVRANLTELFLELEMTDERRKDATVLRKLEALCDALSKAVEHCNSGIRTYVTPDLAT